MPPQGGRAPMQANVAIPEQFDGREHFKQCIHPIRNQMQCGSCWAFAASEVFSDRLCIVSQGKTDLIFSPEDLVKCDATDYACQGGMLNTVWNYLEKEGIVTEECDPYVSGSGQVPLCSHQCHDSTVAYQKYKCKAGSVVEATNVQ